LADNQTAFSGSGGSAGEDNLDDIPNDLLEKLAAQLRGMEGMEGLEGLLPPELLGGGGGGGGGGGMNVPPSAGGASGVDFGSNTPPRGHGGGGEFPGMSSLVDTIMHQLLSKDVLYQPMKDIGTKYPEWLAANKSTLDPEQYKQYEEQYEYIQKICTMYETDPENYSQLMDLLQEVGKNSFFNIEYHE
jgi:Pex19 protein family